MRKLISVLALSAVSSLALANSSVINLTTKGPSIKGGSGVLAIFTIQNQSEPVCVRGNVSGTLIDNDTMAQLVDIGFFRVGSNNQMILTQCLSSDCSSYAAPSVFKFDLRQQRSSYSANPNSWTFNYSSPVACQMNFSNSISGKMSLLAARHG